MTTLRVPIRYGPLEYALKIYAQTPKKETFESFFEVLSKGDINIYGTVATGGTKTVEYLISPAVEFESMYDALFPRHILQQPKERIKPTRESLATLTPEIVGLGLGGILSFGLGVFALATNNTGLATVMAGPFLASILGFTLLFTGIKRKKQ